MSERDDGGIGKDQAAPSGREASAEGTVRKSLLSRGWKIGIAILATAGTSAVGWFVTQHAPSVSEAVTRTPLVTAAARHDTDRLSDGWSMAAERPLDPAAVPSSVKDCETLRQWLAGAGSADVDSSYLRLHLQGARTETITISGLRARVVSRTPPADESIVYCPSAGEAGAQRVFIDLDKRAPTARALTADGKPGKPYFELHTVTLTKGEPIDFAIEARSSRSTVTWQLEVDVQSGTKRSTVVVPNATFRTTPWQGEEGYSEQWAWRWDLQPQRLERSSEQSPAPEESGGSPESTGIKEVEDIRQVPSSLTCKDLQRRGYLFTAAVEYWNLHRRPERMDADGNGIPCETVYPRGWVLEYKKMRVRSVERSGLTCRNLSDLRLPYGRAVEYWYSQGLPIRMDVDGDGIPCETTYSEPSIQPYWEEAIARNTE
jgi:Excalibur calcium-binding domain